MTEIYKNYEIYSDPAYYDMIAVRPVGETRFEFTLHFSNVEKAKDHVDTLGILRDLIEDIDKNGINTEEDGQ